MKFLTLFVFALVCMAVFTTSQVEANSKGNNIVLKDGHLILSTSSGRRRSGMQLKEDIYFI